MSLQESDNEDVTTYRVVMNPEEQYSIWPEHREIPPGWRDAGKSGPKAECLVYINDVWADMRPLSLRRKMAETTITNEDSGPQAAEPHSMEQKDDLVARLSALPQPVELVLRPSRSIKALLERIRIGYVNIKFTNTRGGTELGVALDGESLRKEDVNLETGKGDVHLEGGLTLNGQKVRCIADIDVETFKGQGRLQVVES